MKRRILVYPLLALLLTVACKKDPVIQPDTIEPFYTLPQGNHAYDPEIVEFYRTYGRFILYKFTVKDFRWDIKHAIDYTAEQADEDYVAPSLTFLQDNLFKFYNTDFLKKALPYKIILSSEIRKILPNGGIGAQVNCVSSSTHLAFGHAGSSLSGMTAQQVKVFKGELNREFWRQAIVMNKIALPPAFVASTNYANVTNFNKKNLGVFIPAGLITAQNVYGDFIEYIYVISTTTKEELDRTLFLPANDPAGKFRLKYNAIINFYKNTLGFDLQDISK